MASNRINSYYSWDDQSGRNLRSELGMLLDQIADCGQGTSTVSDGVLIRGIQHQIGVMIETFLWSDSPSAHDVLSILAPYAQIGKLDVNDLPYLHRSLALQELRLMPEEMGPQQA